jgi:putative phage-type endonuclease
MQSKQKIIEIITASRPDVALEEASLWADYLVQLKGCHLYSAASPEFDQEAWLDKRKAGLGGSEIATILGENKWSSKQQVFYSKIGVYDDSRPVEQSEPARWGNLLETTIATEWGNRYEREWIHIPVILQSDENSWELANIDGFTLSEDRSVITGILEIKTTTEYNRSLWEDGPIPFNYICQATWYCGITGLKEIVLVCLVGGQRLYAHELPFDDELFAREQAAAKEFWNENVLKCIEPVAEAKDVEKLKAAEPDELKPPIVFEDEVTETLVESYCILREKIKALTKIKDELYAQIFSAIGDNMQGITATHTITRQISARQSCNFAKLDSLYPDAYKDCVTINTSQMLRIK